MLSKAEWRTLVRLYSAGKHGTDYGDAGSWAALTALRAHTPVLAREVTRLDPRNNTTHYLVVITAAGHQFYERKRRLYNVLYPPT